MSRSNSIDWQLKWQLLIEFKRVSKSKSKFVGKQIQFVIVIVIVIEIDPFQCRLVTRKGRENGDAVRMRKGLTVRSLADVLRVEALLVQLSAGGRR